MLTQFTIRNFAIIDELDINFTRGLTVITGETGAGKSVIINALDFLLGARSSTELIKLNSQKAYIEGTFIFPESFKKWFHKNEFEITGNELTISRELTLQGSKVRINGSIANVSHLLFLKEHLLNIHEQSGHIDLLKIERQLEILDDFGDAQHKKLLEEYKKSFEDYENTKTKLDYLKENADSISKNIDFLKFQEVIRLFALHIIQSLQLWQTVIL